MFKIFKSMVKTKWSRNQNIYDKCWLNMSQMVFVYFVIKKEYFMK